MDTDRGEVQPATSQRDHPLIDRTPVGVSRGYGLIERFELSSSLNGESTRNHWRVSLFQVKNIPETTFVMSGSLGRPFRATDPGGVQSLATIHATITVDELLAKSIVI